MAYDYMSPADYLADVEEAIRLTELVGDDTVSRMNLQITKDATPTEARAELARWLRSGEFQQTTGILTRKEGTSTKYCCLGVACELGVALGMVVIQKWNENNPGEFCAQYVTVGDDPESWATGSLPNEFAKFFGFTTNGLLKEQLANTTYQSLITLNDAAKYTFDQIADVVETAAFCTQEEE